MAITAANNNTSEITKELMNKYNHPDETPKPKNELGKDGFLKLLLTEMKYQDPTSPMDTDKMVQQESQMSQLEQSINLNKNIEKLVGVMNSSNNASAVTYLGREVKIPTPDKPGEYHTGIVDEVRFKDGNPVFVVDGSEVAMGDIVGVKVPETVN